MTDPEALLNVIQLGADMRAAQRTYFRTRTPANLEASKAKERAFDVAAAATLNRQTELLS